MIKILSLLGTLILALHCKEILTANAANNLATDAPATTTLDCTFERRTLCNWRVGNTMLYYRFEVNSSRNVQLMYPFSPTIDHTTSSYLGNFVYLLSSSETFTSRAASLVALNPYINSTVCFTFYYYFYTARPSTFQLSMNMLEGSNPLSSSSAKLLYTRPLFHSYSASEIFWHPVRLTVDPKGKPFNVFSFSADIFHGILAIDDIQVLPGDCQPEQSSDTDCDFEPDSNCFIEPIFSGSANEWTIYQGKNLDKPKGIVDHTTQTVDGHFYGIDLSNITKTSQSIFQVETPMFRNSRFGHPVCFQFSYYLENVSPNVTLAYSVKTLGNEDTPITKKLWQVGGSTLGIWLRHHQPLNSYSNQPFSLIMSINTHGEKGGKVFIDDVHFSGKAHCDNPSLCTFEDGTLCNLQTVEKGPETLALDIRDFLANTPPMVQKLTIKYLVGYADVTWQVFSPKMSAKYLQHDHSLDTAWGNYLLLVGNGNNNRGIVTTDRFSLNGEASICLSLAVAKPDRKSILEVYQGESADEQFGFKLWDVKKTTKNNGNWEVIQIEGKPRFNSSVDLFFFIVGTIENKNSYIAIDDLQVKQTSECQNLANALPTTTVSTSASSQTISVPRGFFRCRSGRLIDKILVCNWHKDCEQGEDEIFCGTCDFSDRNFCRYETMSPNEKYYTFVRSEQSKVGPSRGTIGRNFLVASGNGHDGVTTSIISPTIQYSYRGCTLSFFYDFNETNVHPESHATFKVALKNTRTDSMTTIWISKFSPLQQNTWNIVKLNLGRIREPFRIWFTATEYRHSSTLVRFQALDNVRVQDCQPPKVTPGEQCRDFKCDNGVCLSKFFTCDFDDNCGDGSDEKVPELCSLKRMTSFESGYGRWGEGVKKGWTLMSADSVSSLLEAPTFDHTIRSRKGHYLFASAFYHGRTSTVTAEIDSPPITPNTFCQLRFYMFANSANVSLQVISKNLLTNEKRQLKEIINGDYQFSYQFINIPTTASYYKIILTASFNLRANMWAEPWIAIDDISFSNECQIRDSIPTSTLKPPDKCPTISCTALNGTALICLKPSQMCNFINDCHDGSDEQNCGDCTFDNQTLCGWTNQQTPSKGFWKVVVARSQADRIKVDASGNANGGYAVLAVDPAAKVTAVGTLASPLINGATSELCKLTFSIYSYYGFSATVTHRSGTVSRQVTQQVYKSMSWKSVSIDLGKLLPPFSLAITASTRYGGWMYKDASIDNIKLRDCNPHNAELPTTSRPINITNSVDCSFEGSLCGWLVTGPGSVRSNWFRTSSSSIEPGTDHTSLLLPRPRRYGSWLTTQAKLTATAEADYLRTEYPVKVSTTTAQKYCFTFWYYFFAIDQSSQLGLYSLNSSTTESIRSNNGRRTRYLQHWTTNTASVRNWQQQSVELSAESFKGSGDSVYLYFIAQAKRLSVIGLDDITLVAGECPTSPEVCHFESGNTCDWTVERNGWKIANDFPDHTTNTVSGHYLQTQMTVDRAAVMRKAMSTLPSLKVPVRNSRPWVHTEGWKLYCLKLYYQFKSTVNSGAVTNQTKLNIKVMQVNATQTSSEFSLSAVDNFNDGQLGQWTAFTADIQANTKTLLEIDGTHDSQSTIFIDDISISPEVCQVGSCDFERDTCGWTNAHQRFQFNYLSWMRIQPNGKFLTEAASNFIRYDHSTGTSNGVYLMLPLQLARSSFSALQSPLLSRKSTTGQLCFSLYYFAVSNTAEGGTVALNLKYIDLTHRSTAARSLQLNTTRTLKWVKFEHQFSDVGRVFQFVLSTPLQTENIVSDLGVDDIKITPGHCHSGVLTTTTPVPPSEKVLDCNFEERQSRGCAWKYDSSMWVVTNQKSQNKNPYAPHWDHTYQSTSGHYLLFTVPNNSSTSVNSAITSTVTLPYNKAHCLTLWTYEDGEGEYSLQLYANFQFSSRVINRFSSSIDSQARWKVVRVNIPEDFSISGRSKTLGLTIRYAPTVDRLRQFNIFAIDDIQVKPGLCLHQNGYTYTFADGVEDLNVEYVQPLSAPIGSVVVPKTTDYAYSIPKVDHTTNSDTGAYFLFMNAYRYPLNSAYIDTLSMMNIPANRLGQIRCVRFAYQKMGSSVALQVFAPPVHAYDYSKYSFIWEATKYDKTSWTVVEVNVNNEFEQKVVFYLEKQVDKTSFVALDDLEVLDRKCPPVIDCNFDRYSTCSYSAYFISDQQKEKANANFGLLTAPSLDPHWPGPMYDVTQIYGGGYLFLTAFPRVTTTSNASPIIARIVSGARVVDSNKRYCLSLYTVLSSNDVELRLSLIRYGQSWANNSKSNHPVQLSAVTNITQTSWTRMSFNLDHSLLAGTEELQLLIEGRVGVHSSGILAIDEIVLVEGACQSTSGGLICENGLALKREQICNFVADCPSGLDELNCGTCTFEGNNGNSPTCGWANRTTYSGRWLLTTAAAAQKSSSQFAPPFDADGKVNGHFLMMSTTSTADDSVAEMALNYNSRGMYLKSAYQSCVMQFDYYSQLANSTKANILVRVGENAASWSTIYSVREGASGWRRAYAHIGFRYYDFMVDILGRLKPGNQGGVAVDNVQFVNCSFPAPVAKNGTCLANQFKCKTRGFCISQDMVCNFGNDCGDSSDELRCADYKKRCNFENSLATCGISGSGGTSSDTSNVHWMITSGRQQSVENYFPKIDNTKRSSSGHYLALKLKPGSAEYAQLNRAQFSTAMWTSSQSAACRMRFFYFLDGPLATISNSKLQVYVWYASKHLPEGSPILEVKLNVKGDLQQRWNGAVATFTSPVDPFQFVFIGQLADNVTALAVDDLTADPNCVPSSASRLHKTTTVQATGTTNSNVFGTTTTMKSPLGKHTPGNGGLAAKIAIGITVPVLLIAAIVCGYYVFRKYQLAKRGAEGEVLSMKGLQSRHED